jgi:hypothetical protein
VLKTLIILGAFVTTVTWAGIYRAMWLFVPLSVTVFPNRFTYFAFGGYQFSPDFLIYLIAVPLMLLGRGQGRGAGGRLQFCDLIVVGLLICSLITKLINNPFNPFPLWYMVLRGYPIYVVGRLYLRDADDVYPALQAFCRVMLGVACVAMLESVTRRPIVNMTLGRVDTAGWVRYGLMRAQLGHVNCHGLISVLALLLPWSFEAARWARTGAGPRWWRHMPTISVIGLATTLSRNAFMSILAVVIIRQFFIRPRLRVPMLIGAALVGILLFLNLDGFVNLMDRIEDSGGGKTATIMVNGQPRRYSSAAHRVLLYEVYARGMEEAGAFGFDSGWVRYIPEDLPMFRSIDNYYIGRRIGTGYVGLYMFNLLFGWTIYKTGRYAMRGHGFLSPLAGGLCTALVTFALVLFTIPLFPEAGSVLMWTCGIATSLPNLAGADEEEESDEDLEDEEPEEEPDLDPVHERM